MSRYSPLTTNQQAQMLDRIGLKSIDQLFEAIPDNLRMKEPLDLPKAISENTLSKVIRQLASQNTNAQDFPCFLGAGVYDHFIPAAVRHLIMREEFYTSYTPYQPEISQGMLQAIFEYQSMICGLTGMDAANASMYDGATAMLEAALLASRSTDKNRVVVARSVNPQYRKVLAAGLKYSGIELVEAGYIAPDSGRTAGEGTVDLAHMKTVINENTAAVILQSPNFFGNLEDMKAVSELAKEKGALMIASCDPLSLALFETPGNLGADIAVGEAQPLGNAMSFGGPLIGYFAVKNPYIRKMPGRVVGETVDDKGRRGFVLTLQAREQHIRREKATSNICTNQALCALAASVYLSLAGKNGLKDIALQCVHKSRYAHDRLIKVAGAHQVFRSPYFREFVIKPKIAPDKLNEKLLDMGVIGGYDLGRDYPELQGAWLVAVTEKRTKEEIDDLVKLVSQVTENQGGEV